MILLGACSRGLWGIGMGLSPDYIVLSRGRLTEADFQESQLTDGRLLDPDYCLIQADACLLGELLAPGSVDFCLTSPPYWNILRQRRSADGKERRH